MVAGSDTGHPNIEPRGLTLLASMVRTLILAAILFAGAGVLAVTTPSSGPLLLVRVVLIVLGIALLVLAGVRRRQNAR